MSKESSQYKLNGLIQFRARNQMTATTEDSETPLPHVVIDHGATPAVKPSRRWRPWLLPAVVLLIPIGATLGMYFQPPGLQRFFQITGLTPGGGTETPFAIPADVELPEDVVATLQPTDVVGLARLMPRGDVATVAPPYGAADARLAELLVEVGARVERGQRVAVLDNLTQLESLVSAAEAAVAVGEAALAQTRHSIALSTVEAEASLEQSRAAAEEAAAELERTRSLNERGIAAQAVLDQAVSAAAQAERAVERAEATLARYRSEAPEDQPDVVVALRNLDAARIDLERAERDLAKAYVVAPSSGVVLDIHVRPGEAVSQTGIMDIGDIDQMMVEVEVYQSQVPMIEVGQPVEIVGEALDSRLYGFVEQVGLIVGRQSIVSDDTAANTDARVVEVLVALDPDSSRRASRFTNLEVLARIDTREAGG